MPVRIALSTDVPVDGLSAGNFENRPIPYNTGMIPLEESSDGVRLPVKVVPGASRTRIQGEWNGRLKISLAAPPEQGKANRALEAFLAEWLGIRRNAVRVLSGIASPQKTVHIDGVAAAVLSAAMEKALRDP